jgi:hypothetical protein
MGSLTPLFNIYYKKHEEDNFTFRYYTHEYNLIRTNYWENSN